MTVTAFAVPILASANVADAPDFTNVTASEPTTPDKAALPSDSAAAVVPLYTLLVAVTPVMVSGAAVMFAESVGCVIV